MEKDLKGKELGVGISQQKNGLYSARFVDKFGKRRYQTRITIFRTSKKTARMIQQCLRFAIKWGLNIFQCMY